MMTLWLRHRRETRSSLDERRFVFEGGGRSIVGPVLETRARQDQLDWPYRLVPIADGKIKLSDDTCLIFSLV